MQNVVLHQGSFSSFLFCLTLLCSRPIATYRAEAPPRMHQNSPFSDKKIKKFSGEGAPALGPLNFKPWLRPCLEYGPSLPLPLPLASPAMGHWGRCPLELAHVHRFGNFYTYIFNEQSTLHIFRFQPQIHSRSCSPSQFSFPVYYLEIS